jgi:GDP-L-fucose synthase
MSFWKDQRAVVTGGAGFLGSFVVETIERRGCPSIVVPRSADCDLRERSAVARLYRETRPTLVIHLASVVGGIGANRRHPGRFFFENAVMGIEVIDQARAFNVPKVVVVGTICAYPKFTPVPFREEQLWDGYPEETNAPYGVAKKALLVQCQAYRQEYGLNAIYLLPVNLYGPRDNFDPESSHVIPALIKKFIDARDRGAAVVDCWGTGRPTREFVYVEDAAEGIVRAAEAYDKPEPVNIGSGMEISISDLAGLIAGLCGFKGTIRWDPTQPDGQPRRCLDVTKAEREFGFRARTPFEEGLKRTIAWYQDHRS